MEVTIFHRNGSHDTQQRTTRNMIEQMRLTAAPGCQDIALTRMPASN